MKRVYLAGPDVFFSNVQERSENLKRVCAEHDLEGVFPLDAKLDLDEIEMPHEKGLKIFHANVALIRSCDAVLANMIPFRGPSMDVGTSWEMGCGYGLGKIVVGYSSDQRTYKERAVPDQYLVEDFNMIDNLMLVGGAEYVFLDVPSAVRFLAWRLRNL